jgi:hypothetical protein
MICRLQPHVILFCTSKYFEVEEQLYETHFVVDVNSANPNRPPVHLKIPYRFYKDKAASIESSHWHWPSQAQEISIMVRRKPTAEAGDKDQADRDAPKSVRSINQDMADDPNTTVEPVVVQQKSSKTPKGKKSKRKDKPNSSKQVATTGNPENSTALEYPPPDLLHLQSEVGKLNALAKVMMKRMNFYEQEMQLLWDVQQHSEQKELLASYQQQTQELMKQTHTNKTSLLDQLTVETHFLLEQEQLTQQWIDKLERDRQAYQKRLSLTYEELKTQKQQQIRTQKQLQKVQLQYDRQLQLQQQRIDAKDDSSAAMEAAAAPSSHLVDDMMDSFYKEWSVKGAIPVDEKTKPSSEKRKKKK